MDIDTWLMSCRVLSRTVECATLNYLASRAKAAGIRFLISQYFKTERNGLVKDHYPRLGFVRLYIDGQGGRWKLYESNFSPAKTPIEINELSFSTRTLNQGQDCLTS
jgi:predicted enzyme involved in methoxymalonyl-ACP biosynthesis